MTVWNEYNMLSNSVIEHMNVAKQYKTIMYSAVIAVYGFAYYFENSLAYLIALFIIASVYLLDLEQNLSVLKIAMYALVFLQGEDSHWEERSDKYNNEFAVRSPMINPYILLAVSSAVLGILQLDYSADLRINGIYVFIISITTIFCVGIILYHKNDYNKKRITYKANWEKIKLYEETNENSKNETVKKGCK